MGEDLDRHGVDGHGGRRLADRDGGRAAALRHLRRDRCQPVARGARGGLQRPVEQVVEVRHVVDGDGAPQVLTEILFDLRAVAAGAGRHGRGRRGVARAPWPG